MTDKKKPGRPAHPAAQALPAASNPLAVVAAAAAHDQVKAIVSGYNEGRDLVNQLLGQAQAFNAASQLLQTFGVSKLAFVKETKAYQALRGQKTPNGLELRGTWVEFCELLGVSDEKANQDIVNLHAYGEAALEQMQRMGIGYRELRQYRRLPADEQQALIAVAQAGDKEGFLDLAESLIARHASEKKTLEGKLEAKDKVLADKGERINKLEADLDTANAKAAPKLPTDALDHATAAVLAGMRQMFPAADALMQGADEALHLRARQSVEFLAQQLAQLCEQFDISVDLDNLLPPPWLDPEALAALEARDATAAAAAKPGKKTKARD